MSIIIKIISWFYVIAGFILIVVSASTTDDVDLIYVGALAIVGLAVAAYGALLLHKYD